MKYFRITLSMVMVLAALLMAFAPAKAAEGDSYPVSFSYSCTNNNAADVAGSLGQFSVVLTDLGNTGTGGAPSASFKFYNIGDYQSSITDIYFDDGVLLGIADVINGPGVSFSEGASPGDLPGRNECDPPFETTVDFLADSDPPVQPNGVNNTPAGEYVEIIFDLDNPQDPDSNPTWDDLIAQLSDGTLRIGIHVQGYASGGSESFVTGPMTAIKLDKFDASASRGKVSLNWATGTEIDNAGFNLYRSASADGQLVKVNGGMISAQAGAASGASYKATDAPGYGTFYYWLEDVSTGGAAKLHGPVKVTLSPAFRAPAYRPVLPGN
jgi:hypothetical protein